MCKGKQVMRRANESWKSYHSRLCKIVDERQAEMDAFIINFNYKVKKIRYFSE